MTVKLHLLLDSFIRDRRRRHGGVTISMEMT